MTGVGELRRLRVVSAAPEQIRVSVLGGRTQLDIALPADVPVSGLVPELARLIRSRDRERDGEREAPASEDERRSYWVLRLVESDLEKGAVVRPDQTLREAGVGSGDLLRLSPRRALSPPTLYDDVVDAVGRLNRTAHAAWTTTSARWLAFAGVHLAALGIVYCLIGRVGNRPVVLGLAGAVVLTLVGAATMAHRSFSLDDVAAALGWAAIPITFGIAGSWLFRYGDYGVAAACGAVLILCGLYARVVGTGRWAYLACGLVSGLVGAGLAARGAHARADIVFVTLAVLATLASLVVRRLTARLGRFDTPTVNVENDREDWNFENPFEPPAPSKDGDSGTVMPTAEEVWTKAETAAVTRAGLLAGLAAAAGVAVTLLLRGGVEWSGFAFALACAAVLALRAATLDTWPERAAVAVPAVAVVVITCVLAQGGTSVQALAGVGVLLAIALVASVVGLAVGRAGRAAGLVSYLDYLAVGSLFPLALWVVGGYQRLGF